MENDYRERIAKMLQINWNEQHLSVDLIAAAEQKIPGLGPVLQSWMNAAAAKDGIRTDAELRHKVPDVWKFHKENAEKRYNNCTRELKDLLIKAGIDIDFDEK